MANWIERISYPRELFLAWQGPDHLKDRSRWAVGKIDVCGNEWRLRYIADGPEFQALNQGRSLEQARALGYIGYPAFRLKQAEHRSGVEDALMRRLPPSTRSDLAAYKEQFRIPADLAIPNFAMLAITEAKLPSDGFSVVDPLDADNPDCDLMLEIAGFRYYTSEARGVGIRVGDRAEIVPEPDNRYDPNAVMICVGGVKVGNINRLQAPTFLAWLQKASVIAEVERLNGRADKPRAFVFVRARPRERPH